MKEVKGGGKEGRKKKEVNEISSFNLKKLRKEKKLYPKKKQRLNRNF